MTVSAIYSVGTIPAAITNWLLHAHGIPAYAVVGALVFSEAALFVGFFIPGETAVVVGGVLASLGSVALWLIMAVVVVCAIAATTLVSLWEEPSVLGCWPGQDCETTQLWGERLLCLISTGVSQSLSVVSSP
jgi:hypothetical protein